MNISSSITQPVPLLVSSPLVQSTKPVVVPSTVNVAMQPTSLVPESTSDPTVKGMYISS